jgi:hypothetical protein
MSIRNLEAARAPTICGRRCAISTAVNHSLTVSSRRWATLPTRGCPSGSRRIGPRSVKLSDGRVCQFQHSVARFDVIAVRLGADWPTSSRPTGPARVRPCAKHATRRVRHTAASGRQARTARLA